MTTQHMTNVITHWDKIGLIKKIKKGKEIELGFTDLGEAWKEIINKFEEMDKALKEKRNNKKNEDNEKEE